MNDPQADFHKIREHVSSPSFIEGKGLCNEKNISVYSYNPAQEGSMRRIVEALAADASLPCAVLAVDLYRLFLEECERRRKVDKLIRLEKNFGSEFLLRTLADVISRDDILAALVSKAEAFREVAEKPMVLLLHGVGDAYPFIRAHTLLELIQHAFLQTPVLLCYPGAYNGTSLRLFNRLEANNYYRAFALV